jgi:hypothetical protein
LQHARVPASGDQGQDQREHQEYSSAPPGQLGQDRHGLSATQHGIGTAAAKGGETTTLSGLQENHDGQKQRVEDEQGYEECEHIGE